MLFDRMLPYFNEVRSAHSQPVYNIIEGGTLEIAKMHYNRVFSFKIQPRAEIFTTYNDPYIFYPYPDRIDENPDISS